MNNLILLFLFSFSTIAFSAAEKPQVTQPLAAKTYTEEEFKKAVSEEVEKTMKKVGNGHLVDFSKELLKKEENLKLKELETQKRDDQLISSELNFKNQISESAESQKKILGCIDSQNEKVDKRVSQIVEVISAMKPQNAADILSVQDPDLSVRILGQLDSQKASKIFNLMDKEISARLQKQFLQMKK